MKVFLPLSFLIVVGSFGGVHERLSALMPDGEFAVENGDTNGDGVRDVSDAIFLLHWLFQGGPPPAAMTCSFGPPEIENGDANGDKRLDVSDAATLLGWLFAGGAEPAPACPFETEPAGGGGEDEHQLRIVSPRAKLLGLSYGEWTARWWRWAISLPATGHPFFDDSACAKGQHGPVWFLTGNFSDTPITRDCTVPAGKSILFPVLNGECSTVEPPPFHGDDEASLRACAKAFMDPGTSMSASIDGEEVRHLDRFRISSPLFGVSYPADNILGVTGPGSALSVSDGVWILLAPAGEGDHTLHFEGVFPGFPPLNMTYHIHVAKPVVDPRVFPIDSRIDGKDYGAWGAEWWKWAYSFTWDTAPIDPAGPGYIPDQEGPVFFLAGTTGGSATRSCTLPAGKDIFFPVQNLIDDFPCPFPFAPASGQSLEDFLTNDADGFFNGVVGRVDELDATLDGVPVAGDLLDFRATSRLFTFTADPSYQASDPCITGTAEKGLADGYWLMLKPLSPGNHTLHFHGVSTNSFLGTPFETEVTYHLTVVRSHHQGH